jgi:hypothetical protein
MVASAVSSRRSAAGFSTRPRGVDDQRIIAIEQYPVRRAAARQAYAAGRQFALVWHVGGKTQVP